MSKDKIVEAFRAACRNAETKRGEVCLHASDWMALSDAIAALAAQPRDDVRELLIEAREQIYSPKERWSQHTRNLIYRIDMALSNTPSGAAK